jgi:hypothetical protein
MEEGVLEEVALEEEVIMEVVVDVDEYYYTLIIIND